MRTGFYVLLLFTFLFVNSNEKESKDATKVERCSKFRI